MSSQVRKAVVICSLLIFAFVAVGHVLGRAADDKAFRALTVYSEVLEYIQRQYVDDPDMHQVTSGALHGLMDSLDPQSSYMSPLEYTDYKEKSGSAPKAQAGLVLTKRLGYISVVATLPDSPARRAGLELGDVLEKIAGFTTGQMGIEQAQLLLSGEPGAMVKLSVIRRTKAEPQEMSLTLEPLPSPKLVEDKLQGEVAYLRVPEFSQGMTQKIREKLAQFQQQGAHKLILDLRDCAYGDDQEGVSTAQLFVNSGTITSLKGQTVTAIVSSADPAKVTWNGPVSVLIGNSTAGAAEIVASAIADNHRGETVGDRSYGTASMQKLIQLDDGSALILTVANYYTPAGKEIPTEGVTPTRPVRPALSDSNFDQPLPAPSSSESDPVVKAALDILQGAGAVQKAA